MPEIIFSKKLFDLKKIYNVEIFRLISGVENHLPLNKRFFFTKKNYQKKKTKPIRENSNGC